jgi:hypothetical protein
MGIQFAARDLVVFMNRNDRKRLRLVRALDLNAESNLLLILIEIDFGIVAKYFRTIYAYARYAQTKSTHVTSLSKSDSRCAP